MTTIWGTRMSNCSRLRAYGAVAVLAAGVIAAGSSGNAAAAGSKPSSGTLNEAVITAFTGPESFIGGVLTAGAYPAVYAINHAGGVMGKDISVSTVDTRGDPADALPLVQRFFGSASNLVGVVGPDGATANQLTPLFNQHKVTIISDAGSSNFDHTNYKYFWRLVSPDPVNGLAMAEWAAKKGYKRIALVFGTDTTAQTDLPGIQYGVKHLHLDVVANINLTPDQPSYQADAAQLQAAHPQAIFTEEDATSAGTFFGELAQLGSVPTIVGDSGTIENTWMQSVAGAIGASNFASDYVGLTAQPAPTTAAHNSWVAALKGASAKVKKPVTQWYNEPYAEAVYDGVTMQALAMLASKSTSPPVFNPWIAKVSAPGKGKVTVYSFAAGKAALAHGKRIHYVGVSGPVDFNKWHNFYGNQVAVKFPAANLGSEKIVGVIPAIQLENAG